MQATTSQSAARATALAPHIMPRGLVYTSDAEPGIQRLRRGAQFQYRRRDGSLVRAKDELQRIRSLAIPPAYEDVWICARPDGHLQATGRDARGRKQYRYHPHWRNERDSYKYQRLEDFAPRLVAMRRRVARDLQQSEDQRLQVLATVARLLDHTFARVGNASYARDNGSYGLTTLCRRHVRVKGPRMQIEYRGKSGVLQRLVVHDPRLARVVRRCQCLPGQELFQYRNADGEPRSVSSGDVNDYLQAIGGEGFTAKDFRTWHASERALDVIATTLERGKTPLRLREVLAEVAGLLGNTPAVCRKAYVHPDVLAFAAFAQSEPESARQLLLRLRQADLPRGTRGLAASERRLVAFLRQPDQARGSIR